MSSKAVVRMIKILNFTNISQVAVGMVYFFYSMRLPRASLVTLFLRHLQVDINNQLDILNLSIQEPGLIFSSVECQDWPGRRAGDEDDDKEGLYSGQVCDDARLRGGGVEDHKDEYLWHETMTTPTIPRGQCDTPCRIWPVPTFVIQDLTQWQCSAEGRGQHEVFPSSVPCQHLYPNTVVGPSRRRCLASGTTKRQSTLEILNSHENQFEILMHLWELL